MSTPPHGPYGPPPEGEPQRYGPPPGQGGPPQGQGGPPQGQGGPPQGPPPQGESRNGCAMAAAFAGGVALYVLVNFVIVLISFQVGDTLDSEGAGFAGGAVLLALLALGGGAICFFKGSQVVKALGMGLVFGWSAVSIVTLGYCTGLNPDLYSGSL